MDEVHDGEGANPHNVNTGRVPNRSTAFVHHTEYVGFSGKSATSIDTDPHRAKMTLLSIMHLAKVRHFKYNEYKSNISGASKTGDDFVEKLEEHLDRARKNKDWRREFMMGSIYERDAYLRGENKGLEKGREEGREEGRQEILSAIIAKLKSSGYKC